MPLSLTYTDAYLKTRVTEPVEARALLDVDALGTFPTTPINWRNTLAVLRAYIITCIELGGETDDVFANKLKMYNAEFDRQLLSARAAANAAAESGGQSPAFPIISVPILRG